ncbi:MAG: class I SAM-dependent methyltransferase [Rhodanobacteraceae bacterium]
MSFDYERDTRTFYQDDATAQRYHDMFVSKTGWRNLPSRLVARREQRTVEALLARVRHRNALDIPAGSGKLAGVFASLGTRVVAADIAASMLERATAEFLRVGHQEVDFRVADAADLSAFQDNAFDVVVCLRLMHRVPSPLRQRMLEELARVAPCAIVSFGIESGFHKLRRSTRAAIFGGSKHALCFCSAKRAHAELEPLFEITAQRWISPALSQEMIFLLKAKAKHAEPGRGPRHQTSE